ncbi:unnamed protein product, partial [Porites lobata]
WLHSQGAVSSFVSFIFKIMSASENSTMKAVLYKPGGVENLYTGTVAKPSAEKTQVLIRVRYSAINRADTLQRQGLYPPLPGESEILGLEVSGLIEEVGDECVGKWKKGDQVMALLGGGGYAEYVAVDEALVMPVPDSYKLSDAAAIPEVWLTAYQLLHFLGKVKSGEVVLIHAGGSGVGTALVQLSRLAGARPFVTAGSEEKIKMAESLGAEGGFNYKTGNFSSWVENVTNGQGANVILDCVGSSFWEQNIKSIAVDGHWILYGLLGGNNVSGNLLGPVLKKRVSLIGTTLKSRPLPYKKELVEEFSNRIVPQFANGTLKTIVDSVFTIDEIQLAHKRMESNENIGKIVLQIIAVLYMPGGVENLYIGTVTKPKVEKTKVLIRAHYTAINRADTLQRRGLYPPPPGESDILGLEVAGVIEEIGEECAGKWTRGDHVMALLGGGGYAEYVAVDEALVMPVPDSFKLSDAAAIPEVWLTAYQLLHFLGKVKSGEVVLIHAGGSGVGTALVQLSKLAGARPFVTAGSEEKIKMAESLGAEGGFNYKTGNFSSWVENVTNGQGANVILDCVGSSFWEQNIKSLAVDGRWILYGLLGGSYVSGDLLRDILRKRASLIGTTLRSRSLSYKRELVREFSERIVPQLANGRLKTITDSVFTIDEIQLAHKRMESNENIGKIIIQIRPDDTNTEETKSEL